MSYSPEERIVSERVKRSLNEVNTAVQQQLSGVQDHVNFTLQVTAISYQAYFKCAYECFDRSRSQQEISNCVEYCSAPVVQANNVVENEMSRFQVLKTNRGKLSSQHDCGHSSSSPVFSRCKWTPLDVLLARGSISQPGFRQVLVFG
eukprot:Gb_12255 [translate_table: standard]